MNIANKAGALGTPSSNSDLSSYVDSEEDSQHMNLNVPVVQVMPFASMQEINRDQYLAPVRHLDDDDSWANSDNMLSSINSDTDFSFGPESEGDSESMDQNFPVMLHEMEPPQNLPLQNVDAVQNVAPVAYLPNDMWDTNSDYSTDSDEEDVVFAPPVRIIFAPTKNKDKDKAGKLKRKSHKKSHKKYIKKSRKSYKKSKKIYKKKSYKNTRKTYKKTNKIRFRK